jgi:hypothetical protein
MRTLTGGTAIVTGSTSVFAGAGAEFVLNGFGAPADIEKERAAIETAFKVKGLYLPADTSKPVEIAEMLALGETSLGSVDILLIMQASNSCRRSRSSRSGSGTRSSPLTCPWLSRHPCRRTQHEEARLGPDHQYGVGAFAGRFALQVRPMSWRSAVSPA